jgi:hypothetical protein
MILKKTWFLDGNQIKNISLFRSKIKPHGFMISKQILSAAHTVLLSMIDVEIFTSIKINIEST